jgi:hypothetical protein
VPALALRGRRPASGDAAIATASWHIICKPEGTRAPPAGASASARTAGRRAHGSAAAAARSRSEPSAAVAAAEAAAAAEACTPAPSARNPQSSSMVAAPWDDMHQPPQRELGPAQPAGAQPEEPPRLRESPRAPAQAPASPPPDTMGGGAGKGSLSGALGMPAGGRGRAGQVPVRAFAW